MLAYSVIMLNTDLHNPQIRASISPKMFFFGLSEVCLQKRMTIEDYTKNLRGVNNGTDFSPEFLVSLPNVIALRRMTVI